MESGNVSNSFSKPSISGEGGVARARSKVVIGRNRRKNVAVTEAKIGAVAKNSLEQPSNTQHENKVNRGWKKASPNPQTLKKSNATFAAYRRKSKEEGKAHIPWVACGSEDFF